MLNGTLALHDIRDVEAFCTRILKGARLEITEQDRTDLLAYLIEITWELSSRYQPGNLSFSTWAHRTLRHRVIDWQRQWNGRTRWAFADHVFEREARTTVELDPDAVGTTNLDPAERSHTDEPRMEPGGDLSSLAYLPPRDLRSSGRAPRAPHRDTAAA
jgi:DNA-directed RNA polymerase specialized sigma24 family protein